jgi:DNA-binding NarL/FixJ family response regulator
MIRVLIADDHPLVRSGLRTILERSNQIRVVGEADDGLQTLKLISDLDPDILLLDMEMPGLNGLDVIRELQDRKSIRILALSAYDDDHYILGVLASGAFGYLTKDEAPNTIVEAVRGVAAGKEGWLSRRVTAKLVNRRRAGLPDDPLSELTIREADVLRLLARGSTNAQMAAELGIAERTVRFHLHNLYDKLNLRGRGEAIVWAVKNGY